MFFIRDYCCLLECSRSNKLFEIIKYEENNFQLAWFFQFPGLLVSNGGWWETDVQEGRKEEEMKIVL